MIQLYGHAGQILLIYSFADMVKICILISSLADTFELTTAGVTFCHGGLLLGLDGGSIAGVSFRFP